MKKCEVSNLLKTLAFMAEEECYSEDFFDEKYFKKDIEKGEDIRVAIFKTLLYDLDHSEDDLYID